MPSTNKQIFSHQTTEAVDNARRASFAVSALIAKHMKPLTEGEFVKDCLMAVVVLKIEIYLQTLIYLRKL